MSKNNRWGFWSLLIIKSVIPKPPVFETPLWSNQEKNMGLHACYYPIEPDALANFLTHYHTEGFSERVTKFREESDKNNLEFYIGTTWHVLDFVINSPKDKIPELAFAVRGHQFPALDGSIQLEPHLPSYDDEFWQIFSYVTSEEAQLIARYLPLIDESEFNSRFVPEKMVDIYHSPLHTEEKKEYFELLLDLHRFYGTVANNKMAVLISIG